jgi:RNA polymerase sigma-70 factor, ECF subfamily
VILTQLELETLYSELEKPLYNFALRWVWNPSVAEELLQEAFLRVWRHRDNLERSTLKALFYKTVQNLALNERRKSYLRKNIPLLDWFIEGQDRTLELDFIKQQNLQELKAALEALPLELKETLLLTEFSDLTQEEIGKSLGIPAGTVASRRNRALKMMQISTAQRNEKLL